MSAWKTQYRIQAKDAKDVFLDCASLSDAIEEMSELSSPDDYWLMERFITEWEEVA